MMTTLLSAAPVTTIGASSAGFNTEAANMGIGGAGITALLGYSVVFFGLVLLMCVIALFGRIMAQKKKPAPVAAAPAAAPAAVAAPAPGSTKGVCMGNRVCELYNVDDKTAAMIMAIVADETKIPLNELRFISIKEL